MTHHRADHPPGLLLASNLEQWIITMTEGVSSDAVDSRAYSGRLVCRALGGNDTFLGGAGADYADGGTGNDSLNPGGGSDVVQGGEGNDSIEVRDGVGDVVDCGAGTDTVTADRSDAALQLRERLAAAAAGPGDRQDRRPEEGHQGREGDVHLRLVDRRRDVRVPDRQGRLQGLLEPVQGEDQEAQDREAHADASGPCSRRGTPTRRRRSSSSRWSRRSSDQA